MRSPKRIKVTGDEKDYACPTMVWAPCMTDGCSKPSLVLGLLPAGGEYMYIKGL